MFLSLVPPQALLEVPLAGLDLLLVLLPLFERHPAHGLLVALPTAMFKLAFALALDLEVLPVEQSEPRTRGHEEGANNDPVPTSGWSLRRRRAPAGHRHHAKTLPNLLAEAKTLPGAA